MTATITKVAATVIAPNDGIVSQLPALEGTKAIFLAA